MANLITHHDPFHIHKILGVAALLHFVFRLWMVATTGVAFLEGEGLATSVGCVLVHGALSWSSLLLPLTMRRIFTKPMIWPEFRLHSILFASRHVLGTVVTLLGGWCWGVLASDDGTAAGHALRLLARLVLVLGTTVLARHITTHFGNAQHRTTNAMPYPAATSADLVGQFKSFYANAQFHATVQAVSGDATMAFVPLYAIQGAPFLMTLVRKGKGGGTMYHVWYTLTLLVPYLAMAMRLLLRPSDNALPFVVRALIGRLAIELRIYRGWSRVGAWACSLLALTAGEALLQVTGWYIGGPMALMMLVVWAARAHMGQPDAAEGAADAASPPDSKAGAAEAHSRKGRVHTASANPFRMVPAMWSVWKAGQAEATPQGGAGDSD